MELSIAAIPIAIGSSFIIISSFYLFHHYGKIVKKQKTTLSIFALRHASILGISGILIVLLGILYLIEAVPWWS